MKKRITVGLLASALCVAALGCSGTQGSNSVQRFDCDYTLLVRYQDSATIQTITHQQCGFSLREDLEFEVLFRIQDNGEFGTPQPGSTFVLTKYIVTYTATDGGGQVPGVHVPQPFEFSLGFSEFLSTSSSSAVFALDGAPILDGFAKFQAPLRSGGPGETRTYDALVTVYGHPIEDSDAECIGTFVQRFRVTNVAIPDSDGDTVPDDPCAAFG